MKKTRANIFLNAYTFIVLSTIVLPIITLVIWSFASRWPWPNLLPVSYSFRTVKEVLNPYSNILGILCSNILLSLCVAILSAIIAIMTARALTFYDFPGKKVIYLLSLLPNMVPGTVFAMGIHVIFIKLSLSDTLLGVILVHLIYTLPYSVSIMKDLTDSIGKDMEIQACVLGASPFKSFKYISLPILMPGIIASISMAYIISYSQYFLTLLIGGGKIKTLTLIMVPFIAKGDRRLASAYALVFILSTAFFFKILDKIITKLRY